MSDILVIGSLNADLVLRAPRFPLPGETIQGEDLVIIPGGKGANQAVAAARLGAKVSMIGRVGSDAFGDILIKNLKNNNIDEHLVNIDESTTTGTAVILVDKHGQNSIVLSPGANARVTPSDVKPEAFSNSRLLLLQLEIPIETVIHSANLARERGLRVLLNPAPAYVLPDELLKTAEFIIPNEIELSVLTGKSIRDIESVKVAGRSLMALGARNIIVTLGEQGAVILNKDGEKLIPAFNTKIVDSTAAGDAFIGGMAVGLLNGKSLEDAVQYACACGALAVEKFGAQPSLPTLEEVNIFLNR